MIYAVDLNPSLDRTLCYESLTLGQVNRAHSVRSDLSGKGINVATALRGLGVEVAVIGLAGGTTGRVLTEGLLAAGYDCAFVPVAGETRCNITVVDEASDVTTKLNERGPQVTADELAALETLLLSRVKAGDWCVLSGSLPPGAPADTYARLIARLRELGLQVVLDTSGAPLALGCAAGPALCKPNEIECAQLLGQALDLDDPALPKRLRGLGPQRVLLTLGARGALWSDGEETWLARPPEVAPGNNVGAGDAALAGAVYGLQADLPADECLRWAVAMGTAKIGVEGTGMPTRAIAERIAARITILPVG